MGGVGSGRLWGSGIKRSIRDYKTIDVRLWQRDGWLHSNKSFLWEWSRNDKTVASIRVHTQFDRIILSYQHQVNGDDRQWESYPILLDRTRCNFGGERPWFLCPTKGCGQRVSILYSGRIFACRECLNLTYESQRELEQHRAIRRADNLRDRLGWEQGIINGIGKKPKGMHWKTFKRLIYQYCTYIHTYTDYIKSVR